jgi:hypothetical protein
MTESVIGYKTRNGRRQGCHHKNVRKKDRTFLGKCGKVSGKFNKIRVSARAGKIIFY